MAKAASEKDLEIKQAATGDKSLTENIHPSAETIEESEGEGPKAGLETLTPKGTPVLCAGEEFLIKGWQIGDALEVAGDLAAFGLNFASIDRNDLPLVMAVIVQNLPTVLKIISVTIKRDAEFVKTISFNELPDIIQAIYSENEPFFRRIAAILPAASTDQPTTEETPNESKTENAPATETPLIGSD